VIIKFVRYFKTITDFKTSVSAVIYWASVQVRIRNITLKRDNILWHTSGLFPDRQTT